MTLRMSMYKTFFPGVGSLSLTLIQFIPFPLCNLGAAGFEPATGDISALYLLPAPSECMQLTLCNTPINAFLPSHQEKKLFSLHLFPNLQSQYNCLS